ncbi:MAG: DUF1028 domain-containing protein [Anaerolineales bacterium]|nr:DUF1028 domain-containing protein [Anaerolineales bacterium]
MTYSIVAYDLESRQFGVAVQTHQPAVGAIVPWVRAGVGAVATQSLANIAFGPQGLDLLAGGASAAEALSILLARDEGRERRQVAIVDRNGQVAVHSGDGCIPYFGHKTGAGYSVQANMMTKDTVPDAMAAAYEAADGDLMHKLMCALEAAEAEGGDIRGSQSAAIVVYGSEDKPHWENRICDLRVDEHPTPVAELRRLVTMRGAELLSRSFEKLAESGDLVGLQAGFAQARVSSPDPSELTFWQAILLADKLGLVDEARELLAPLFAAEPQWAELLRRLVAMGPPPAGFLDHPERWG